MEDRQAGIALEMDSMESRCGSNSQCSILKIVMGNRAVHDERAHVTVTVPQCSQSPASLAYLTLCTTYLLVAACMHAGISGRGGRGGYDLLSDMGPGEVGH